MVFQHKNLALGRWRKLSLVEQLANIGSEVSRAVYWRKKDKKLFQNAVWRALELFDLTLSDSRFKNRLKEVARVREVFCETVFGEGKYKMTLEDLERYFFYFAILARRDV